MSVCAGCGHPDTEHTQHFDLTCCDPLTCECPGFETRLPRVWFYGPEWYWPGWWWVLAPVHRSADEWGRRTLMFGWPFTGRLIVAYGRPNIRSSW